MAEIHKFKSYAVKNIFIHVQRKQNDGHSHKNENIDLSRTMFNYSIKSGQLISIPVVFASFLKCHPFNRTASK